jgi:hypothetical protein
VIETIRYMGHKECNKGEYVKAKRDNNVALTKMCDPLQYFIKLIYNVDKRNLYASELTRILPTSAHQPATPAYRKYRNKGNNSCTCRR